MSTKNVEDYIVPNISIIDSEGNERPLGRLEQLRYLIAFLELQVRDLFEAKHSLQHQIDVLKQAQSQKDKGLFIVPSHMPMH